jgi:hypothetical protein
LEKADNMWDIKHDDQKTKTITFNGTINTPNIEGTHIKFIEAQPKPKTKVWWVVSKYGDSPLGTIAWFSRWRKYSFFPKADTVYEWVCLREIADFCMKQTKEHKKREGWVCPKCGNLESKEVTYLEECIHCGSSVRCLERIKKCS